MSPVCAAPDGPKKKIQQGIDVAVNGDEVVVAIGTYNNNITFDGKAITLRSTDPNDAVVVMHTIIGGRVTCQFGEGPDTVLSGFVITGGNGTLGGGMLNENGSSPTVTNCTFSGNSTSGTGGGIFNEDSNPTVTNTGFCNNTPDQINGPFTDGGGNSLMFCPPPIPPIDPCPADIDGDGLVSVPDLLTLLAAWGPCP